MAKRVLKVMGWIFAGALVAGVVGLSVLKAALDASYFRGYDPSAALDPEIGQTQDGPGFTHTALHINGFHGSRLPLLLALPKDAKGPLPCVVFLHGIGDDKDFMAANNLDEPFLKAGFAFVCFDQLTRGERKIQGKKPLEEAEAFRVRAAYTVNDTRRVIDYLETRPDIAPNRIYLCGASYGAITGSTATAFDKRIRAAALTYGGGNLVKMLTAKEIAHEIGKWMLPAQIVAWYFGSVWDPVKYIGQIAPRPVLIQNGTEDTVIDPACARALQEAAREPKIIKWYQGDHLGKTSDLDMPLVTRVLDDALKFIQEQDAKIVRAEGGGKPGA